MRQVFILVEGQTEEAFVRDVLNPHLASAGLHAQAVLLTTKRLRSGTKHKGGVQSWSRTERELRALLNASHAVAVTTMIDLYGLPADWPGRPTSVGSGPVKVDDLEQAMATVIANHRFVPHLMKHEFEALLFAEPEVCGRHTGSVAVRDKLAEIVARCGEPELIDDGPTTAPSKRLQQAWPHYVKTVDGPAVTQQIGIPRVRNVCPHFDAWLMRLEAFGNR